MICRHCQRKSEPASKFCSECGSALDLCLGASGNDVFESPKKYKVLNFFNWLIGALAIASFFLMVLKLKEPNFQNLFGLLFVGLIPLTYIGTALFLSQTATLVFGFPLQVKANSNLFFYLLTVSNVFFSLLGLIGVIACIFTKQLLPAAPLAGYLSLSLINLKGLFEVRRSSRQA